LGLVIELEDQFPCYNYQSYSKSLSSITSNGAHRCDKSRSFASQTRTEMMVTL